LGEIKKYCHGDEALREQLSRGGTLREIKNRKNVIIVAQE
jgi:hypothetical protein